MLRSEVEAFMGEARTSSRNLGLQMFMCFLLNKLCLGFVFVSNAIIDHFAYNNSIFPYISLILLNFLTSNLSTCIGTFPGELRTGQAS